MSNEQGAPRVAVGAVVLDRHTGGPRVLLVRRAQPPLDGQWSLPGGKVELGERLADAVAREVREEAGVDVRVGALLEVVEVIEDGFHYVILDYACELVGGALRAGSDVSAVEMVPVFDVGNYGVTSSVARVISRAIAD